MDSSKNVRYESTGSSRRVLVEDMTAISTGHHQSEDPRDQRSQVAVHDVVNGATLCGNVPPALLSSIR